MDRRGGIEGRHRIRRTLMLLVSVTGILPCLASAQPASPAPGTLKLSEAERADLLSHNTEASVDDARAGLGGGSSPSRQVHGEVGAAVGSNGLRSVYGAAAIPFGSNAGASVYFEDSHYGRRR